MSVQQVVSDDYFHQVESMSKLLRRSASTRSASAPLFGHSGFVESLLSRSPELLVSVDSNGEVVVWDVEGRRPRQRFVVSSTSLSGVAGVPGSEDIVVWGWEGAVVRLSVPDLTGLARIEAHDERIVHATPGFCAGHRVLATASMDATGALVDLDSGEVICRSQPHGFWVVGAFPLSDSWVTVARDGTIHQWDIDGNELASFELEGGHFVSSAVHDETIVAASLDGTVMAVDIRAGRSRVLDARTGREPAVLSADSDGIVIGDAHGELHLFGLDGTRQTRVEAHEGGILGGLVDRDRVVSWGLDRIVTVMERSSGTIERRIDAHENLVGCATFLETTTLVTGSADQSIRLHDLSQPPDEIGRRHRSLVRSVSFIDGSLYSLGYSDPVVMRWDPSRGEVVDTWEGHHGEVSALRRLRPDLWMSASNDGSLLLKDSFGSEDHLRLGNAKGIRVGVPVGDRAVALGMMVGEVVLYDLDDGEQWRVEQGEDIFRIAYDPELGWIGAMDGDAVAFYRRDGTMIRRLECRSFAFVNGSAWVFTDGQADRLDDAGDVVESFELPLGEVEHAASTSGLLIVADSGGRFVALDPMGKIVWEERWVERAPSCVAVDDDWLVVGWHNAGGALIDATTGEILDRDAGDSDELVVDVTLSRERKKWAVVGWDDVRVVDVETDEVYLLSGLEVRPDSATFVGETVWVGGFGGAIWVWEPRSDDLTRLPRHDSVLSGVATFSDGRFATWGWDGRLVIDGPNGKRQREWGGHGSFVCGAGLNADERLVSWSFDGTARVWSTETGADLEVFRVRSGGVQSGVVSNDGLAIWLGTSAGELYCWMPGQERVTLFESEGWHRGSVHALALSGEYVASVCRGGRLGVWDAGSGINIAFWDIVESGGFEAVAGTADGAMIAAGGTRGTITAVDPVTGSIIFDISAHGAEVRGLAFAPDDDILYSVSKDGTLAAWDFEGELVARARLEGEGYCVAATGGGLVATGDGAGHVHFFDFARDIH